MPETHRSWRTAILASVLSITLLAPVAIASDPVLQPDEAPDRWSCDESGQLVCAGANAGANVDCTRSDEQVVSCEYTYGQLMGGASPLNLPGHVEFSWSVEVTKCLTDAGGSPISCETTTDSGQDSCTWPVAFQCVLSLGPNETPLDPVQLEESQCYEVTVEPTATARAWMPSQDPSLANAEITTEGSNAGIACWLDNGR